MLHEIVGRYSRLPVEIVAHGQLIEVNHVYVLSVSAELTIAKRRLQVRASASRRTRKPIDIFFSSLAIELGELSAGIILSGGDSDGTLGIKSIKERGGLTLAQVGDGFGPHHPDMPHNAISTGFVDFAIPVQEMGAKLTEFANRVEAFDGREGEAELSDDQTVEEAMPEIYGILRNQIGHDFSGYKIKTFMRRVHRRMHVSQLYTVEGYVEKLRQDPQEVGALFRDLLINVTNFFRDDNAFENLARLVVPKMFEGRGADDTVRVWVPGCSTGEEVFSIAILMREHMDTLAALPRVQIFATDIDDRALAVARAARYPVALLDTVSPERRRRFFIPDGGSVVVSKDVRELCIFSPHSVIRDPPFSRIDLVSCRNLLIYFGADVQNQVIPIFHYALAEDGHLFLGSAENVSQFEDLFEPVEKRHRIFRRRPGGTLPRRIPLMLGGPRSGHATDFIPHRTPAGGQSLRQSVDEHVLERFSPPHVVVNRDGDVIYYSSRTGKYLEAPAGNPTRQLLTLARKGLRLDLRTLLRDAIESGRSVSRENISVEGDNGTVQLIDLTIEPLGDRDQELYLVLFVDHGPILSQEDASKRGQIIKDGPANLMDRELRETRDRLQSLVEEYETALEELKSSNEELVSVNEEMQSTNEELEASKEELQSVNEELHTVNSELNGKVDALDRANSDLQNLFESTALATVFLDKNLVIRTFTPAVQQIFNILPGDRGRPITDLSSRLTLSRFADDIATVFAGAGPLEQRVESDDQTANYLVRLGPYKDSEEKTEGVVITFVDITSLTRFEARQRLLIAELQHRTRNLLSLVQSVARQTLGNGGTLGSFSTRLEALGRVQNLVGGATGDHVDLTDIVHQELLATGVAEGGKISVSGPPIALGFDLVQTFGLALHELATNAVKHGALREGPGRLDVAWEINSDNDGNPVLTLKWEESGIPSIAEPSRKGFGRELIERALPFTLRAKTNLSFGQHGVSCEIEMPLPLQATNGLSSHE
jgi:two-component system CheB/CheR fusion protein